MASEIKMPQLSDTMNSGKILSWRKKEGDTVRRGDILAEVETDKANLEIECFQEGTLLKILAPQDTVANVGDAIAFIGNPGEALPSTSPGEPKVAPLKQEQSMFAAPESPAAHTPPTSGSDRVKASPLARKIARDKSVDLSLVSGSGPGGRITRKDVELFEESSPSPVEKGRPSQALERVASPSVPSLREPTSSPGGLAGTLTPLSKMREVIARRMQESVREAPHFYVTASLNMQEATRLREALKKKVEYKGISMNHMVMKAAAYALKNEPRVNRAMRDGAIFEPSEINIGIITALEDGLLIPVIRNVDQLPLKDLVFEARAATERARAGRPTSSDLTGGTFSISNMGMFDIENFTAIINPGQGAVLAVSSVRAEPVVQDGAIVAGLRMKVTLSVDHRIIDGIMAANFLSFFKEALEMPAFIMG